MSRLTLTVEIEDDASEILQDLAKKERRTPGDQAAILLEAELYFTKYGQFEKPEPKTVDVAVTASLPASEGINERPSAIQPSSSFA